MRFRVLDGWRGVSALLVALFHLNAYNHVYSSGLVRNAYIFVDFFFVLSGFVISHTYRKRLGSARQVGQFVARRFARVWPLHAVVLLAFVGVEVLKLALVHRNLIAFRFPPFSGPNSISAIFTNLALVQSLGIDHQTTWNFPSWSISAEFWTYIIFAAAIFAASTLFRRLRYATDLLLVTLLVGSVVILVTRSSHGIDATFDLGLFRCLYGFLVGHYTYRLWSRYAGGVPYIGLAEIFVVTGILGFVSVAGYSTWTFLAPIVFAVAVFVFASERGPVSRLMTCRPMDWLGRISYSIYMLQAFVIAELINRPIQLIEKLSGHMLTTMEAGGAMATPGGDIEKLIVLGGPLQADLLTLGYLALLLGMATLSFRLIECPGRDFLKETADQRRLRVASTASHPM